MATEVGSDTGNMGGGGCGYGGGLGDVHGVGSIEAGDIPMPSWPRMRLTVLGVILVSVTL